MPPKFPSIPMPTEEQHQLYVVAMAMKQVLEAITLPGTARKPTMYTTPTMPADALEGDFWLVTGTSTTLNILTAGRWFRVGTLT